MATERALYSAAPPARRLPPRRNWQVPVFFLGLAALAGVWYGRSYLASLNPFSNESALAGARDALGQSRPDIEKAQAQAQRVLEQAEPNSPQAGEAHYVLGTALLVQVATASESAAIDLRKQARMHLERAEQIGVPETDRVPLTYKLGKVWYQLGVDPQQVIPALARVADLVDDPFEAYGLLAQAFGRLEPPNPMAVLEAVRQQVNHASPLTDPGVLAKTRLQLGELYLKAQNVKEARIVLGRIGPDAPPTVAAQSRTLLALSFEESEEWSQAARNWEQLRTDSRVPTAERPKVLYHLGLCYVREQRAPDAQTVWQELSDAGGPEGQAAALRLAELQLEREPAAVVLSALTDALKTVSSADDFRNPLLPLDEARALFERAGDQFRARGEFEAAGELAKVYAKIAAPGRDDELAGLSSTAWAESLKKKADSDAANRTALLDQAAQQLKQAAQSYVSAAGKNQPGAEQADRFWRAADMALRAKDYATAADALGRYVQLDTVVGEAKALAGWYQLGETNHALGNIDAARAAYQRCLKADCAMRFRARNQLATLELTEAREADKVAADPKTKDGEKDQYAVQARIKFDDAEKLLQSNLAELREAVQSDPAAQEQTLFVLADVAFERQDFATAEQRLTGVLQQYSNSSRAARARQQLGRCYWNEAIRANNALRADGITDEDRRRNQKQLSESLQKALEEFLRVEESLQKQTSTGSSDADTLRQVSFSSSECLFYLSKYDDALKRYLMLADRYQNRVETLIALSQVWQCYRYLKQPEKAVETLTRMKDTLEKLPDSAFDGTTPGKTRSYWTDWLIQAAKQN